MKYAIIGLYWIGVALFVTFGCTSSKPEICDELRVVHVQDSIKIYELTQERAAIIEENENAFDSLVTYHRLNDTLRTQLFLASYKVEKVKFYLAIVDRDATQSKFLKGWVRRAVE